VIKTNHEKHLMVRCCFLLKKTNGKSHRIWKKKKNIEDETEKNKLKKTIKTKQI
jgi:hypothetical protein